MGLHKSFIYKDKTIVREKIKEAFTSVIPISLIVLILCVTITPIDSGVFLSFAVGTFLVIVGMGLFTLGADTAMTPIGEYVGTSVVKTKKLWIIIPIFFLVGVLVTIAEPDLSVLAGQLKETVSEYLLLITVGIGVGVFLVIAFLRMVLKIKLKYVLLILYTAVFVLAFFVPKNFVPLAFDSGGVTTGPMSVPFIIAIGTGVASLRSDGNAEEDGFGLTALCSVGPIISVMILGIIFKPETFTVTTEELYGVATSRQLFGGFIKALPLYLKEVGIALFPILVMFFVCFLIFGKISKNNLIKILIGILYTYFGLVIFLLGVNKGFLPVGSLIGEKIGELSYRNIIIPIGMIIGFFVVAAEPAVHVLTEQVYEITSGAIPKKALSVSLMVGVSVSVGLSMLRILTGVSIMYFLIPGYLISLVLTFFVPDIFTGVAFDSGGVASGAMTASFLLPLALGLCKSVGGNLATEGFGVVAMVAMTPLITIQILGLIYKIKTLKKTKSENAEKVKTEEIID